MRPKGQSTALQTGAPAGAKVQSQGCSGQTGAGELGQSGAELSQSGAVAQRRDQSGAGELGQTGAGKSGQPGAGAQSGIDRREGDVADTLFIEKALMDSFFTNLGK